MKTPARCAWSCVVALCGLSCWPGPARSQDEPTCKPRPGSAGNDRPERIGQLFWSPLGRSAPAESIGDLILNDYVGGVVLLSEMTT
jgi:hypothetical protein